MLKLDTYVEKQVIDKVREYTECRFSNMTMFKTPEALTLYELNLLSRDLIKELCEREYGRELQEPYRTFVPLNIAEVFYNSGIVPVAYFGTKRKIVAVYLPELDVKQVSMLDTVIEQVPTTIYYYFESYRILYNEHKELREVPEKIILSFIYEEGISLGAADVTISNRGDKVNVYYNVRKKKVHSKITLTSSQVQEILTTLTMSQIVVGYDNKPRYLDVDINSRYRGRVTINTTHKGYAITIRFLPKEAFNHKLEELNIKLSVIEWMRTKMLDGEAGLRLIVGEPMSGKNTTALALLHELTLLDDKKVVSVEMPVEQELDGVEQINTDSVEDYVANIQSLIRQNPDFVYITEMIDETGLSVIKIANVGKRVLSTLHANSVSETLTRLMDITGYSLDRIIQVLHSVCFQQLVRNDKEDTIVPKCRVLRFSKVLKYEMYGKSLGEVIKIIEDHEEGDDVWIST